MHSLAESVVPARARPRPRCFLPLALTLLLAGCVAAGGSQGALSFLSGDIKAEPPRGYCTDPKASADHGESAVILMAPCSGSGAVPALISISVGTPGSSAVLQSGAKALSDYFLSPAGRAALARDGQAGSVRIAKTLLADGALIMRIEDRNAGPYWRAVLGLKSRLVTISVMAGPDVPPVESAGRRILDSAISAMRAANRSTGGSAS